jgi:hypothetical protein
MQKAIKYLPLFYPLLVLIGFLNYHTFYKCFDIEIASYLTTGELLLSFLPLTIPILLFLAYFFLLLTGALISILLNKDKEQDNQDDKAMSLTLFFHFFKKTKEDFKNKDLSKLYKFGWFPFYLIFMLLGILFICFFGYYIFIIVRYIFSSYLIYKIPYQLLIISAFFWIIFLFDLIDRIPPGLNNEKTKYLKSFFTIFLFVSLTVITSKSKAFDIISGKPQYNISFELPNNMIQTDSTIVFLGKTTDFIFLRDLKNQSNLIYPTSEIRRLEIGKTKLLDTLPKNE